VLKKFFIHIKGERITMKQLKLVIEEQECNSIGYEFGNNIPTFVTKNLFNALCNFKTMSPHQIIALSILQLFEERKNENIDYLQVFNVFEDEKQLTFWAISNHEVGEQFTKDSNLTFLLPSDY